MPLAPGTRLGPYEILSPIGAGGMGEIHRARDTRLGREVAVKVLPEEVVSSPERRRRFEDEARAASALSHPNLLTLFDVGDEGGVPYLVTELLDGETLREKLVRGPVPAAKASDIALQVARGLAAAHERGIVHRDLKPDNIFLTAQGHAKILDFGLAKMVSPLDTQTQVAGTPTRPQTEPGMVLGTVAYMSPEQVRGQAADPRSDLFALGVILTEMLSGRSPFRRGSAAETMAAILKEDLPKLSASGLAAPPALDRVARRLLEKLPRERFQTARQLILELEHASSASGVRAAFDPAPPPTVAVLPFADMSPGRDQDYFCEGMAEELINELSRLPGLRVVSRTAAFQFKGMTGDVRVLGDRLGATSVLEGSVRKSGERLRITLQLVSVAEGYPIWSGRYDRDLRDVFAVQEEIAASVAQAMRGVITELERQGARPAAPRDVEAYECYLRGRQYFYRFDRRSLDFAAEMFRRAAAIDPGYALAYAGLADCASFLCGMWGGGERELAEADRASRRALELAPGLSATHASRGLALYQNRRYEEAETEFVEALRLDPEHFEALYFSARMRFEQGRMEEAADLFSRASAVRPEDYQAPVLLGMVYRAMGREADSLDSLRRGLLAAERHLELNPDDARASYLGGLALIRLGQRERGLDWARRAIELEPNEPIVIYNVAGIYALAGESEPALDCLERAFATGFGRREWLERDSDFVSLFEHPRFLRLVRG